MPYTAYRFLKRRVWLLLSWLFVLLSLFSRACSAGAAISADDMLELLKANDAQFDNVVVDYDYTKYKVVKHRRSGTTTLEIDRSIDPSMVPPRRNLEAMVEKYFHDESPLDLSQVPDRDRKWVDLLQRGKISFTTPGPSQGSVDKVSTRNQFCIRWPDIAVRKTYGPDEWTKYSVVDQQLENLFAVTGIRREWFHGVDFERAFPNVYQEEAIWLKFALGIGYSDVIGKITSMESVDGKYLLKVDVDWWSQLSGQGTLQLDESLIVRAADLHFGHNRLVVATAGEYDDPSRRFMCARKGTFTKYRGSTQDMKFDVLLQAIEFGATNTEFDEIADMETPEDEVRYEMGRTGGGIRQVRGPSLAPRDNPTVRWIIVAQVIIVVVLAYLVVRKRLFQAHSS